MNNAIGRVTSILSIPYGYTVSLWSAGALTVSRLGPPSALDVLLFVVGAVIAFVALAGVGHTHLDAEVPMRVPSLVVMNLFPIVAALAVLVVPTAVMGRNLVYLANSFLATATYVLRPEPGRPDPIDECLARARAGPTDGAGAMRHATALDPAKGRVSIRDFMDVAVPREAVELPLGTQWSSDVRQESLP